MDGEDDKNVDLGVVHISDWEKCNGCYPQEYVKKDCKTSLQEIQQPELRNDEEDLSK